MNPRTLYLVMLLISAPAVAGDTVHRWVDERGVVNYGDAPPKGVKSRQVPTDPALSGLPAEAAPQSAPPPLPPPPPVAGTQAPPATVPLDRDTVREELERALQRSEAERARLMKDREDAERAAARQRCEAERRVDCGDDATLAGEDSTAYLPHHIRRRLPPPHAKPPVAPEPPEKAPPSLMRRGGEDRDGGVRPMR
jgi:hypothetical protein